MLQTGTTYIQWAVAETKLISLGSFTERQDLALLALPLLVLCVQWTALQYQQLLAILQAVCSGASKL